MTEPHVLTQQESVLNQQEKIRTQVREGYGKIAESTSEPCCGPSSCCSADASWSANQMAEAIGYAAEELEALPEGANMGLSCGNPVALASLKPGEVVVDLGSGGGFDIFIAGRKVGPQGRAIGVDMTYEMLSKARGNIEAYRKQTGLDNVEFRLGEIEHLPLADNSVDVIISNCVINLSPDKPQVWRDVYRVLKPGGRVAISDMALLKPLPDSVRGMVEALIGCVAGALLIEETQAIVNALGFEAIRLEKKSEYMESLKDFKDPMYQKMVEQFSAGESIADYVTSLAVWAQKPNRGKCCG